VPLLVYIAAGLLALSALLRLVRLPASLQRFGVLTPGNRATLTRALLGEILVGSFLAILIVVLVLPDGVEPGAVRTACYVSAALLLLSAIVRLASHRPPSGPRSIPPATTDTSAAVLLIVGAAL